LIKGYWPTAKAPVRISTVTELLTVRVVLALVIINAGIVVLGAIVLLQATWKRLPARNVKFEVYKAEPLAAFSTTLFVAPAKTAVGALLVEPLDAAKLPPKTFSAPAPTVPAVSISKVPS